jgi:DNA-binding LacI/PurR family transcriptional regulator
VQIDPKKRTPLHRQIADNIRSEISSGIFKGDDQVGSHQELARKYGVSLITIKRALSDLINEGLLYSQVGKGTFVQKKPPVRSLPGTKSIGLVLGDLKSPFFSRIVDSVEEFASFKGYNLLVSNSAQQLEREESLIRHYHEIGVSGIILASMTHEYTASHFLRKLNNENYPCIVVSYIKDPDIYFVGTDHEQGGYIATRHLIEGGHREIGYVSGEKGNVVGALRKKGYLKALHDAGFPVREKYEFNLRQRGEWHDYNSGYEVGEEFASLTDRPTALFIYNDLAALGFEQAVLDSGLSVPDDVAIVGFDGIERGQYAPVPLTTIQQPFDKIGSLAVENLIKRIEGQPVNIKTVLEPKLVVRDSCGNTKKSASHRPTAGPSRELSESRTPSSSTSIL